jgi:hypothetical protein
MFLIRLWFLCGPVLAPPQEAMSEGPVLMLMQNKNKEQKRKKERKLRRHKEGKINGWLARDAFFVLLLHIFSLLLFIQWLIHSSSIVHLAACREAL